MFLGLCNYMFEVGEKVWILINEINLRTCTGTCMLKPFVELTNLFSTFKLLDSTTKPRAYNLGLCVVHRINELFIKSP